MKLADLIDLTQLHVNPTCEIAVDLEAACRANQGVQLALASGEEMIALPKKGFEFLCDTLCHPEMAFVLKHSFEDFDADRVVKYSSSTAAGEPDHAAELNSLKHTLDDYEHDRVIGYRDLLEREKRSSRE
jgi:hypothetical protein